LAKSKVTPKGIASFAHLATPDTKGQYADNKFKVTLKLKKGEKVNESFVKELRAEATAAAKQQMADWNKKKLEHFDPVKDGDDKDEAEKKGTAGFWLITFKGKYKPKTVDAKRRPLPQGVLVLGGDEIKVAYGTKPFAKAVQNKGGISLYLNAVQLLQKNNDGNGAANAFDEEEGYEAGDTTGDEQQSGADDDKGNGGDF
jgi:hypothetical protein